MRRIAICLGASKIFMRTMISNENTLVDLFAICCCNRIMGTTCNASEDRRISTVLLYPLARLRTKRLIAIEAEYHRKPIIRREPINAYPPRCQAENL